MFSLMQFPKIRVWILPVMAIFFFLLIVFFTYAAVKLWREDVEASDEPEPMALQEAIERSRKDSLWVALQNTEALQWDCSTIVHWEEKKSNADWMDIAVTDQAGSTVIVVALKDQLTCSELPDLQTVLSGELSHLAGRDFDDLNFQGRLSRYPQTATFLNLCTYCDPNQSTPMIALSLFCMVGSVALMVFSLRETLNTRKVIRRNKALAAPQSSAEHPVIKPLEPLETDQHLMQVFDFTPADLAANVAGQLSPRQKERLAVQIAPSSRSLVIVGVILIVSLVVVILGAVGVADSGTNRKLLIIGMFFLVGFSLALLLDFFSRRNLQQGRVSMVCGPVTRKVISVTDQVEYCAKIEGKTFTLSSEQYHALTDGGLYYFYYMGGIYGQPRGSIVLSVKR